ncbi:hypothetical protein PLESTB_000912100 [Pleodorina starrii]|uniref:Uncharacterized protein n=1 Tax=Pleodorina starrii TaxID=330485 RepID=A0A9W6BP09_9CHLO|nr:hypothetical protein PLESTM_001523100 [Pleodorina starrii]GLC54846.1 hypothetical protein PLESTB_000912100 [Pleodorina starrii]GLC73705.1 hypothetical protein PLESTF_001410400 [Pleodorina starrii]
MQDNRGGLPRRSSGSQSLAAETSQSSHDLACSLRTNPLLYPGPVSPDRRKISSYLVAGPPHCPDQQPRAPFSPPGVALTGPWLPFSLVPLPPKLVFETWWHEGPHQRINMHVTYDTATKRCLAGTYVSLDMEVTTPGGGPVDEFDLHVGAEVRVAGKRVTLRKPLTLATQTWLDQQARAMLVAKYRIEGELSKFRPVVPVPSQYPEPKRAEPIDFGSHQHMPAGGRVNLRALYDAVLQLAEQLRQHRGRLPPLPDAVGERVAAAAAAAPGPPDWSPERREAERREAEARQREALLASVPSDDHTWRNDLTNWLDGIPLAASCCTRYAAARSGGETGNRSGKEGHSHSHGHGHGHGHRSGHRSVRPSAGGMLAGAGSSGGVGGAASVGLGGSGSTLAFNLSVLSKLAAMASVSGTSSVFGGGGGGGLAGAGVSGAIGTAPSGGGGAAAPPPPRVGSPVGASRSPLTVGSVGPATPRAPAVSAAAAAARQR